jgi:ketosteroid isomerase-like protein
MSQENVEIVRRGFENFNQQFNAQELDLSLFAPDVVLDNSNAVFDGAVYRGHDGVRDWYSWLRGMWKRQQVEPLEFIPFGEAQVIVPIRLVSVGRDDVETVARAAVVVTVREHKIAHLKPFQSKAEALAAVGLSEQDAHADS